VYGGGPLAENQIVSLALADNGRKLAVSVTWKAADGQHGRIVVVRTRDHSVVARRDLRPAVRYEDVVGANLTAVGSFVVADQRIGEFGHRLYVINTK
jgi:hypothetical protein